MSFCMIYIKTKYEEEQKLCYMETDCFIDIVKVGERRLDTSNYELDRPLSLGKY